MHLPSLIEILVQSFELLIIEEETVQLGVHQSIQEHLLLHGLQMLWHVQEQMMIMLKLVFAHMLLPPH